jgi:hypothetical protein
MLRIAPERRLEMVRCAGDDGNKEGPDKSIRPFFVEMVDLPAF